MIKNFTLFLTAVSLLFLSACKYADKYTQFYLDYNTEIEIPAVGLLGLPLIEINNLFSRPTQTNSATTFSNNNTRTDLIESIKIEAITLSFIEPQNADFDFLESIEIFISSDSLNEVKIAERQNIPFGLTILTLEINENISDEQLAEYIKAESYTLRSAATFRRETNETRRLNVASRFFIDAKLFNI
jgi:hypothetical protein